MLTFEPMLGRVQGLIEQKRLPGVVLRVCRAGEMAVEAALGEQVPGGAAMQLDSIFRIYSMTKPITSAALMMLLEAGRLHLDDPITRFFPEFERLQVGIETHDASGKPMLLTQALTRPATVRDLLRHTAGFTYGWLDQSLVAQAYSAAGVERGDCKSTPWIERLAQVPLAFQPGSVWQYSRATDVLGILIERLTDMPLDAFLHTRIFAPLGMVDTGFIVPAEKLGRVAEPFARDPDQGSDIKLRNPAQLPGYASGGGGLMSTLNDYQRFIELLRGGGQAQGVRLLSRASIEAMMTDQLAGLGRASTALLSADCGFGFGLAVRQQDGPLGHAGDVFWSGIAGTFFWIDRSMDLSAVWLMQAPNQRDEMRDLFRHLVYQSYDA